VRILPFQIDELTFTHTEGDDELDRNTRARWRAFSDAALFKWRRDDSTQWCEDGPADITIVFSVSDGSEIVGTWAFYRVQSVDGDTSRFTALLAPMFPEILDDDPDWDRISRCNDWFLANEMQTDSGTTISWEKRRKPEEDDSSLIDQHRWDHDSLLSNSKTAEINAMRTERISPPGS